MTDQAENLRRLVQAQRDWKELADEPSAPRPVEAGGGRRARRSRRLLETLAERGLVTGPRRRSKGRSDRSLIDRRDVDSAWHREPKTEAQS